ncbi:MAG: F0F1 ATP synthase subunit B [Fimbriimonadales bacterium]|nr:F0F1 ATP synthase subunit B [Fimbriimonadales bacterium]
MSGREWLLAFGKAAIGAALFWGLSTLEVVHHWNEITFIKQLGIDLRHTLIQIGALVLMFPAVHHLFLVPLKKALDERTQYLETTYQEAESLKARMQELKASYEERLAQSEAEAREKIQQALKEAQGIRDRLIAEARTQAEEIRRRASQEMEREREKMLLELRSHVAELTLLATERLLKENVDSERQRRLVQEFIESVEVKPS